jgi:hypothetical protein
MLVRDMRRFALVLGSAILLVLLCVRLYGPAAKETLLGLQVGDWSGGGRGSGLPTSSPHVPSSSGTSSQPFAAADPPSDALLGGLQPPPPPQQPSLPSSSSSSSASRSRFIGPHGEIIGFQPPAEVTPLGAGQVPHTEISSVSTRDRNYFPIRMGSAKVLNPNIIPHPRLEQAWIVVAQKVGNHDGGGDGVPAVEPSLELVCTAMFIDGALTCIGADGRGFGEPTTLPVRPTAGDPAKCTGELEFFNLNVGPHDARVFYGPRHPYTIYGSNSNYNCFGQWIRDFRGLVPDWDGIIDEEEGKEGWYSALGGITSSTSTSTSTGGGAGTGEFTSPAGTELQRPPPYGAVEKNWFLFWDPDGVHYVHYDMTPRSRAFARLHGDGSVGEDLGAGGGHGFADAACLARYLPDVSATAALHGPGFHESLHQATNSLSVTLCRRGGGADPAAACTPDDNNTFILAVLHHKIYRDFHSVYEPYAVLFRRRAPFDVFAVSSKPLWISGRQTVPGTGGAAAGWLGVGQGQGRADTTEMFYVTSISWKDQGLKYHGHVDDVMFLAFGIEDERAAGIDVQAGSLLANLGLCDDDVGGGGFL